MPRPSYDYECGHQDRGNHPACRACGLPGRYVGYRYSTEERWSLFERLTGLCPTAEDDVTPQERKRRLNRFLRCQLCAGTGLLSTTPGKWWYCPRCLGDGAAMDGRFRGDV